MTQYETKDSGEREQFKSGMQRDTERGKPRFDLMIPDGVPFEDQLLTRFAMLLERGAQKYDERNWEQADGDREIRRAKSSAFRHFMQWLCGERDEDHAAAVMFNLMVVETIGRKVEQQEHPVLDLADILADRKLPAINLAIQGVKDYDAEQVADQVRRALDRHNRVASTSSNYVHQAMNRH